VIVAVAFDHAGFPLRETVMAAVRAGGHEVLDCGPPHVVPADDYPDYAELVSYAILDGRASRAVLACGSGIGAAMAACKFPGIRASMCHDCYSAHQGVEHDDMNVLCLGARVVGPALAEELIRAFVGATFSGEERHRRRLAKVAAFEKTSREPR
jgi:ribose 5-phosphate isomerase B